MGLKKKQPNQRTKKKRGADQSNKWFVWARYLFFSFLPLLFKLSIDSHENHEEQHGSIQQQDPTAAGGMWIESASALNWLQLLGELFVFFVLSPSF